MSTGYCLAALSEILSEQGNPYWFAELGLATPKNWRHSRIPTVKDFREAFGNWEKVQYAERLERDDLAIWITENDTSDSTIVTIAGYGRNPDENCSCDPSFNHGSPELLVALTQRLARECGPFLLILHANSFAVVDGNIEEEVEWVNH